MAKTQLEKIMVTEHVFEIRYAASGTFLDKRGYLADYIRGQGIFPHWRIEENIIHFHDAMAGIEKIGAFVGYKSAGFISYNAETTNYFEDKSVSYWNHLRKNAEFKIPEINRFGARTKAFLNCGQDFPSIRNKMSETFLSQSHLKIVGGSEEDFQIVLDMKEEDLNYKLTFGPIHKDEAGNYFNFRSEHFKEAGIFLDIDYYVSEKLLEENIPKLLKKAMKLKWEKIERIAEALGL